MRFLSWPYDLLLRSGSQLLPRISARSMLCLPYLAGFRARITAEPSDPTSATTPHRQQERRSSTTDSDEPTPAKVSSKIHVQTRHLPK